LLTLPPETERHGAARRMHGRVGRLSDYHAAPL
jgi:hypothetical protein